MSLDIILWASSKPALASWAATHPATDPLWNGESPREGVNYCWWAGTGQFMTAPAVLDQDGTEITPPTFAPGVVALVRLHSSFFESDSLGSRLDAQGLPKNQWGYSKTVKWIRDNGTPGTVLGINYYEVDGVRIFRPSDVEAFLEANNIPGHIWVGGNNY